MSENAAAPGPGSCPLSAENLAPASRKFVQPDTPPKMKKMAARGIIPMPPSDLVQVLFMLTFDPDEEIRQTARSAAAGLSDKILTPVLRGELPPPVLDFLADALIDQEAYLELILLNNAVPDTTFVRLASKVAGKSLNLIAQNQLRLLREPDIVRALAENPNARGALLDQVFDFAVRSGLNLTDVPAFQEARRRILGDEVVEAMDASEPEPESTAEGLIAAHAEELGEESSEDGEASIEEKKRETITQKIMKMTVAEKIKLAILGNKEARTILLRDSNKLVLEAVVNSPRITEGELIALTNSRTIPDTVLRTILLKREIMRVYQVKVNLVNNPKTPLPTALKLLPHLRVSELRTLGRNRNVSQTLRNQAKKLVEKKTSGGGGGGE